MIYADYDFYRNEYRGDVVEPAEWQRLAVIAGAHIDRITFARLRNGAEITDSVRMAVCAAADVLHRQQSERSQLPVWIKSENTDGYSVSYEDAVAMAKREQKEVIDAIKLFLPSSDPLRYAGVC